MISIVLVTFFDIALAVFAGTFVDKLFLTFIVLAQTVTGS